MKYAILSFLLLGATCFCDVLSNQGKIDFSTRADGQPEMTLNSTGLGVGVSPSSNLHVKGMQLFLSNCLSVEIAARLI